MLRIAEAIGSYLIKLLVTPPTGKPFTILWVLCMNQARFACDSRPTPNQAKRWHLEKQRLKDVDRSPLQGACPWNAFASRVCVHFSVSRLRPSIQQNPFCIGCAKTRKCSRPPSSEGILIKVTKWDHEDNPHLHGRGTIWYSQLWMATSPKVPMYKNSESICIPSPK